MNQDQQSAPSGKEPAAEPGPESLGRSSAGAEPGGPSGYGGLKANLKLVGDSGEMVWWDRGYQVHVESQHLIQHVTFRLADSLPRHVVEQMDAELKSLAPAKHSPEKQQRLNAYLDAGHGSCILREPAMAKLVQDALLHFHGQRYTLHAWCIMPNHVHVLFQQAEGWTMSKVVATWKSYTGRRISSFLKHSDQFRSAGHQPGTTVAGHQPGPNNPRSAGHQPGLTAAGLVPGGPRVWHREYWDRFIRDEGHYVNAVNYIHNNPVKARLVRKAEDWQWSSAARTATFRTENDI